jgi:hypothetical protein
MKKLATLLLAAFSPLAFAVDPGCIKTPDNPFAYRVAYAWYQHGAETATGTDAKYICMARELRSEADWRWLDSLGKAGKGMTVTVLSAARLPG